MKIQAYIRSMTLSSKIGKTTARFSVLIKSESEGELGIWLHELEWVRTDRNKYTLVVPKTCGGNEFFSLLNAETRATINDLFAAIYSAARKAEYNIKKRKADAHQTVEIQGTNYRLNKTESGYTFNVI